MTLRAYTDKIAKSIGQPVLVINRPGAQGAIGSQATIKEPPDGYTFMLASLGQLVANKYTMKSPGYDADKDFVPVALLGRAPYMVLVNPSLPVRSLADLAKYDRENPGKISLAYEGAAVLAGSAYLKRLMGLSLELVAYNSPLQAIQDTIGGTTQVHMQGTAIGLAYATSQKLPAIAVTTDKRLPQLADVPTVNESYPGFGSFEAWLMIVAAANTPPEIIQRMSVEIARAGDTQELRDLFSKLGFFDNEDRTPQAAVAYLKQQNEQFAKMAKAADLKPE
ncbi:MAG: Bug family tripartite tricarboxylate transporter substrate binding protein [Xanthobacteraceae bacterium]